MKDAKVQEKDLIENLKKSIAFFQALGVETLPIRVQEMGREPVTMRMPAGNPRDALKTLQEEIGDCRRCKLSQKRTTIVFGEGNPEAELMFIGEAPGREEDLQARPFVGDAGKLLTRLIEKMGYRRQDVYIANIVKCRPPMNRDPEPDEIECCRGFLESQITIIRPKVIVALGRVSALTLIGNDKLKITAIRGKFFDYKGIPFMPTFHPAYLIRNPKDKWLTWSDMQEVLERLGKKG
ncbi:MAG: uracil-DNA glycosylase [Nitrospirota bacterium]